MTTRREMSMRGEAPGSRDVGCGIDLQLGRFERQ
jgi:hypothetical protein